MDKNLNRQTAKQKKIRAQKTYMAIKIQAFFLVLFLFAIIGLLIFLRPTESKVEKRELEKFPSFTLSAFLDGSYFNQISTWYADTFPFREALLQANSSFKNLYGIHSEQFISNSSGGGDEIPSGKLDLTETESKDQTDSQTQSDSSNESSQASTDESQTAQTETQQETLPDGTIHAVSEVAGDIYISGNRAFGLYYFSLDGAKAYINMMNKAQERFNGIATIYDILAPTSVGIGLDDEAQKAINSSNQKEAFDLIFENLNENIKKVSIFDTLKAHNSEYIYFNTDHHWTALGAYYAYEEFCKVKGITPTPIDEYQKVEYPNFLGSFYASSNQSPALAANPDTLIGYIPKSTNSMVYYNNSFQPINWFVVNDVSEYDSASKYSAFVAGDEPFAYIDNPTLNDGSACAVVKESYGNAFIPFLVDHYQHVYIVDYRYFSKYPEFEGSLHKLVTEKNVQDIIFLNNSDAITNIDRVQAMEALLK